MWRIYGVYGSLSRRRGAVEQWSRGAVEQGSSGAGENFSHPPIKCDSFLDTAAVLQSPKVWLVVLLQSNSLLRGPNIGCFKNIIFLQ